MSVKLMDCTLRDGADAGDGDVAAPAIEAVKKAGLKAYSSLMKAYLLSPDELAEEGERLEAAGLDEITIMDSAGTMLPDQVAEYTRKLKAAVKIPVAFHCHNNLGLSAANALAAYQNGADILDCGLMGMARSAGNLPTEVCVGMMQRIGELKDIDFYGMLDFIDKRLIPAMAKHDYKPSIPPLDLVLGYDPFVSAEEAAKRGFEKVDTVEELLERSDLVNVNVPLVKSTTNLVSREAMTHFKPGAVFVNAARGGVIDEDALYDALVEGRLRAAACDTFVEEPVSPDNKLLTLRNFSATPHLGGNTEESLQKTGMQVVQDTIAVLNGNLSAAHRVN